MADSDNEIERDPEIVSESDSDFDDGSDNIEGDGDGEELEIEELDSDNGDNDANGEGNDNDDAGEGDDSEDDDEDPSNSDDSDNDQYGINSPTSQTNKSSTYLNKQNKKYSHPEPVNTDFNNPENTNYLEKLNNGMRDNFVITSHPESITHNYDDVKLLSQIKRNAAGVIDDPKHRMIPFITKYEMTRILGIRAQQIDNGAQPTITLDNPELISGYFIAKHEFSQNKLPFIIKRSFPCNGGVEYWNVCDLDIPFQY